MLLSYYLPPIKPSNQLINQTNMSVTDIMTDKWMAVQNSNIIIMYQPWNMNYDFRKILSYANISML